MRSTWSACSLLLLTMAAASRGRNATQYFQQARFQHRPSRPEDAVVFSTATAPPLVCELEMAGDWTGGNRLKADLILSVPGAASYYTCSFEGNATTDTNLRLIQTGLPDVFTVTDAQKVLFSDDDIACITDSQLPDEYFQLQIQRPDEERPVKCRNSLLDQTVFLRFPGYPTIICPPRYSYSMFTLPSIVGNDIHCGFQVYADVRRIRDEPTAERLHQSLVSGFPTREDGGIPNITCVSHAMSHGTYQFQVRLPGDTIYDCRFSDT